MISLLKSEKADANVLFIKIEIEHGTKKTHFPMKHYICFTIITKEDFFIK